MTKVRGIPFVDLVSPHAELEEELLETVKGAFRAACFVGGPKVEEFEDEFARFCEVPYCVAVASGTDAVRFAVMAAGVRPGDTVITVPNTFIATAEAITQAGAQPEFVDVHPRTCNLDPVKLAEYLEKECDLDAPTGKLMSHRTKSPVTAIIPVHLYGQTADMDAILNLAERYGLIVVEDACQAHGAGYYSAREQRWRMAGSMGKAAGFSFYPGKNLGACGEGGAVTTHDPEVARVVRTLRDHGQARKYHHEMEGYNGRLDAIQAAILSIKLRRLAGWNAQRRNIAARYNDLLGSVQDVLILPFEPAWAKSNYHLYVIRIQNRDELLAHLQAAQIGVGIHYPIPLHLQKAYEHLGYRRGSFPVAERTAAEILSLPMFPHLGLEDQRTVASRVGEFVEGLAEYAGSVRSRAASAR